MSYRLNLKITFISILLGALFIFQGNVSAQADTLSIEKPPRTGQSQNLRNIKPSDEVTADTSKPKDLTLRHARIATISSALVPGLGQAYNKKYWKIPLIYGSGTVFYFYYNQFNERYTRIRDYMNTPVTKRSDPELDQMSDGTLKLNKDYNDHWRTMCIIGLGLVYVANVVDAMVDSYMEEYDISKDLSLRVSPTLIPRPNPNAYSASYGIKMSLRF